MRTGRSFHTLDKDLGRVTNTEAAQRHAFRPVWRLGLAVLLLVAALILATAFGLGNTDYAALAAGLIVAGWLGLAIGSNDVANSLGPAVGAGAIGLLPGLLLVALAEVAGASLAGGAVTDRLANGIIDARALTVGIEAQIVMLSALVGAAAWITTATGIGLPVSTSHSIVGGIAGAGMAALGTSAVEWTTLAIITSTWLIAPLIAGAVAGLLVIFVRLQVLDAADRAAAARVWLPLLVGAMSGLFASYLVLLARPRLPLLSTMPMVVPAGVAIALIGAALMRRKVNAELILSDGKTGSKRLFRPALLVAATMMGFAHGANDVGNVAGPLSVILAGSATTGSFVMPVGALLMAGLAIALGTLLFGRRLVVMVGSGITRLNAGRAFCVSLATAATVLASSALGLPVSTTHVAVGGIFGVGFAREWLDRRRNKSRSPMPAEETRRRMLIRRSHVATIAAAWVVTVPATALLGGACCLLILRLT
ncbi:inorganic phosphate transporter [Paracoccus salsus]|uniref:inorganic phosphate transporter n=1 Tax=Paracoccus salsus TaxID=2911061 RepID=UPI001F24E3C6|nr:inorganic phosphate transporter [Paracoccus salsus]MCF3973271.1 inorganic phosphate transporter [Paracoccus salsus]